MSLIQWTFLWIKVTIVWCGVLNITEEDGTAVIGKSRCVEVDGWMGGWVDGWMGGWVDGWMGGWVDGWMGGWVDGWMGGWVDG